MISNKFTFSIITALFVFWLSGCGSSSDNTLNEVVSLDSNEIENAKQDSLNRLDENKVLDKIEFGINEKEFDKKIEDFNNRSTKPGKFSIPSKFIGEYEFFHITGLFNHDKLYGVYIQGSFVDYEKYKSELFRQVNFLKLMLEKKYGPPIEGDGPPEWYRTEKGYTYLAYGWKVGKKKIEIRVSNEGVDLTADLSIYQPKVRENVELAKDSLKNKKADQSKSVF